MERLAANMQGIVSTQIRAREIHETLPAHMGSYAEFGARLGDMFSEYKLKLVPKFEINYPTDTAGVQRTLVRLENEDIYVFVMFANRSEFGNDILYTHAAALAVSVDGAVNFFDYYLGEVGSEYHRISRLLYKYWQYSKKNVGEVFYLQVYKVIQVP